MNSTNRSATLLQRTLTDIKTSGELERIIVLEFQFSSEELVFMRSENYGLLFPFVIRKYKSGYSL